MDDQNAPFFIPQHLYSSWLKISADFWETSLKNLSGGGEYVNPAGGEAPDLKTRSQEQLEMFFKGFQALNAALADDGLMDLFAGIGNAMPDALSRFVHTAGKGYLQVHQLWLSHASRVSLSSPEYHLGNLEEAVLKAWTELYEKELQPFFHVPRLGLLRFYQEKNNQALDAFNRFQTALTEFMFLLSLPMEKAFRLLQDEVNRMLEQGTFPEDFTALYQVWVRILEKGYMQLFKSSEYLRAMHKALNAFEDFLIMRDEVMEDALKISGIPSQKEMDALYKEIYLLKKTVKALTKRADGHARRI